MFGSKLDVELHRFLGVSQRRQCQVRVSSESRKTNFRRCIRHSGDHSAIKMAEKLKTCQVREKTRVTFMKRRKTP